MRQSPGTDGAWRGRVCGGPGQGGNGEQDVRNLLRGPLSICTQIVVAGIWSCFYGEKWQGIRNGGNKN